jgi:hypothetical protein
MWRGAEPWLIATFLLLFGAAAMASLPVTSSLQGKEQARSASDRPVLVEVKREVSGTFRQLVPKRSGGGKDLLPARAQAMAEAIHPSRAYQFKSGDGVQSAPRLYQVRAPPVRLA